MSHIPKTSTRRYYADWVRVIAVCVLVIYHTTAMFNPLDPLAAVKGKPIPATAFFSAFIHEWRLALLFIVSGGGTFYALGSQSWTRFVRGRFRRLIVPLIFGTLLLVPPLFYVGLLFQNPSYARSFPQFYALILFAFARTGRFGQGLESLHWAHLWFLAYLFCASLLALPLFLYLRGPAGRRVGARLVEFLSRKGMVFLLALPLVAVEVLLRARWASTRLLLVDDWASFLSYTTFFVYGFLIFSDERLSRAIERHAWAALTLGVLTSALYLFIFFTGRAPHPAYNLPWSLYMVLRGFNKWFWCVAVLGLGAKYLNFNHRLLPFANEAVYPVYVLHLPVATLIAYWVVGWNVWPVAQLCVITLGTLAVSVCVYAFIIRQTNLTRFLFGLKPKKVTRAGGDLDPATGTALSRPAPGDDTTPTSAW